MTFAQRLAHGYKVIASALTPPAATVWHRCPHCEAHTPWVVRTLQGYYRCTACGRNPLEARKHA